MASCRALAAGARHRDRLISTRSGTFFVFDTRAMTSLTARRALAPLPLFNVTST